MTDKCNCNPCTCAPVCPADIATKVCKCGPSCTCGPDCACED